MPLPFLPSFLIFCSPLPFILLSCRSPRTRTHVFARILLRSTSCTLENLLPPFSLLSVDTLFRIFTIATFCSISDDQNHFLDSLRFPLHLWRHQRFLVWLSFLLHHCRYYSMPCGFLRHLLRRLESLRNPLVVVLDRYRYFDCSRGTHLFLFVLGFPISLQIVQFFWSIFDAGVFGRVVMAIINLVFLIAIGVMGYFIRGNKYPFGAPPAGSK